MIIIKTVKNFLQIFLAPSDHPKCRCDELQKTVDTLTEQLEKFTAPPPSPDLEKYKVRRKEIADSDEPIEGVFYIIDDIIVPDYYSECLFSEADTYTISHSQNPRRRKMYCPDFYFDYICKVYRSVAHPFDYNFLPRGRVRKIRAVKDSPPAIYVDRCYLRNLNITRQLIELYRLPKDIEIITTSQYS